MLVSAIFGSFAVLSLALLLWQWAAARRFPLHQPVAAVESPAVTLLKPLKGCDETTEDSLRSWLIQDYGGPVQVLFGVASAEDPVFALARKLITEFPNLDAEVVICAPLAGANAKASKLAQLERRAKHAVLVISDADVRVPRDLLTNIVASLMRQSDSLSPVGGEGQGEGAACAASQNGHLGLTAPSPQPSPPVGERESECPAYAEVGLVNCFYRLANPSTLAMRWEAVAINADFWSQVLQSASFRKLDFALGAVMATRRKALQEVGGFAALINCLADDYQFGNRLVQKGYRIELCPVVVECWSESMGWRDVWKHQLRWARTIRVCQPWPYFFSILANVTLWAITYLVVTVASQVSISASSSAGIAFDATISVPTTILLPFTCLAMRLLIAHDLQRRLTRSNAHAAFFWLTPLKDLLQAALLLAAFAGNKIEWRGERYRLRPDGTLVDESSEAQKRGAVA